MALAAEMLQPQRDAVSLDDRQRHGEVACILVEDLAARLAFLLQRFQFGKHRGHQLDDDGGGDVGHDAQGEDSHAADRAARQGVEDVQHAAAGLAHLLGQRCRIDAGHGDVAAQARHDQGAQGKEDAAAQLLGLGDGAEVEIGCQLFGCGRHQAAPRNMPMIRTGRTLSPRRGFPRDPGPTLYGDAVPPFRGRTVQFYALRASRFLADSVRRVWRLPGSPFLLL